MSKMKGGFLAMAAMMAAVAYGDNSDVPLDRNFRPIETDEDKKRRLAQAEIKRNKANGLKEFFFTVKIACMLLIRKMPIKRHEASIGYNGITLDEGGVFHHKT